LFFFSNSVAPLIIVPTDLFQARYVDNITLECQVASRPYARVIWLKNDRILSEKTLHTREDKNQTMTIHQLHIQVCASRVYT